MRMLLRTGRIAWVLLYHVCLRRRETLGVRLHRAFQELGVTFVKFGQLLSGRYDMLPEEDLRELRKLLDRVDPLPDEAMLAIVRQELGARADELQNAELLASASIAQTYTATFRGRDVVVKVLRPGIRERIELDLSIIHRVAQLGELLWPMLRRLTITRAVRDMRDWIREETDFTLELRNMERYRFHLASTFPKGKIREDLGRMVVPVTYPDMSTSRVLVMERLEGVTLAGWMRGERPADEERYDPQTSVMTLFVGSLRPVFQGMSAPFHGDPHPANIVVLPGGDIGLIDFGLMGQYGEKVIRAANSLYFAIHLRNAEKATQALLRFAEIPRRYYEELLPSMEAYIEEAADGGFAEWMQGAARVMLKHKLSGSVALPLMVKFVLLVDGLAHEFFPGRSTSDLLGSELEAAIVTRIRYNISRSDAKGTALAVAYVLSEIVAEGPEVVGRVLGRLV